MDLKKLLLSTAAVGVVGNILDYVFHGVVMAGRYAQLDVLRKDMSMGLLVLGDFVVALVFVWIYDRVYGSFGGGPKGGATYGLYLGVAMNFPLWIFMHLLLVGFPYWLSWVWTIFGIVWAVILGAVAGATYKK
jgi:hypothetical protein